MAIINTIRNLANVQMMKYKVASQKGRVTKLENQVTKLQHLIKDDILSITEKATAYKGNSYTSYASAISEVDKKYRGIADWGSLQTGIIVDLRAAFTIGEGLVIVKKDKSANKELEWAERFLEYNDLDEEVAQEFAKEAEIEGKIALKLALEEDKDAEKEEERWMVSVRYISWIEKNYTVETNPQDYLDYQRLKWRPKDKEKEEVLEKKEFVYKKFGGRIYKPNEAAPKVMKCLTQIENLDKALRDWREINRIFGGPILYAECETEEEVKEALNAFSNKNFKLKKILAGTFKLSFITLDTSNVESIENEITTNAKLISGTTGIPVHYLGFPNLMSNRATAENLMEMINAGTTKERKTWKGAYEEVIRKAMNLYNEKVNQGMSAAKKLNPDKIGVEIPLITKEHWEHLEKVYLPAAMAGKISDEAFLEKMPGIDIDTEAKRKAEKEKSEIERIMKENEDLKAEKEENKLFGGGESAISE